MEDNEPPPAYLTVVKPMHAKTKDQTNTSILNSTNPTQTLHPMQRIHPGKLDLFRLNFYSIKKL